MALAEPGFTDALGENHWPPGSARLAIPDGYDRMVFPANQAITFPLSAIVSGPAGAVHHWELEDLLSGEVVLTGASIPVGGTWTLPARPAAAYRWAGYAASSANDPDGWGDFLGDTAFITTASTAGLPAIAPGSVPSGPGGRDDYELLAHCGLPLVRLTVRFGDGNEQGWHDANAQQLALYARDGFTGPILLAFPNYTVSNAADVQRILAMSMYAPVTHCSTTNEPGPNDEPELGMTGPGNIDVQKSSHVAIKSVRPDVKVMLLSPVHSGRTWAPILKAALDGTPEFPEGIAPYFDEWTWHEYPGPLGAIAPWLTSAETGPGYFGDTEKVMADYDAAHGTSIRLRPRMTDEPQCGGAFAHAYGAGKPGAQAYGLASDLRFNAQHGIAQDRYALFYGRLHDIGVFPSGISESDPAAPARRSNVFPGLLLSGARAAALHLPGGALNELRPWVGKLDFGDDQNVWVGNRYGGPDGQQVLDVQSVGVREQTLNLQLAGTVPATLAVRDHAGNPSTVPVTAGAASIVVSMYGGYVFVPSGCTATVVKPDRGWLDGSDLGVTTDGPYGSTSPRALVQGPLRDALVWNDPNDASAGIRGPLRRSDVLEPGGEQVFTLHWTGTGRIVPSLLKVVSLAPHQDQCTVLHVEVRDDDGNVLGERDETPGLAVTPKPSVVFRSWYVQRGAVPHAMFVPLTGGPLRRVHVAVKATTYGGAPDLGSRTGYGRTRLTYNNGLDATANQNVATFGAGLSGPMRAMPVRIELAGQVVGGGGTPGPASGFLVMAS